MGIIGPIFRDKTPADEDFFLDYVGLNGYSDRNEQYSLLVRQQMFKSYLV
jgi:hypothetical protein